MAHSILRFANRLIYLPLPTTAWQRQKAAGATSSDLRPIWLPTLDTLRNFFLAPAERLIVVQMMPDVVFVSGRAGERCYNDFRGEIG